MNKLKFSHDYEKLPENWEGTQALLIGIQYITYMEKFKWCFPNLIKADTRFRGEEGYYPIDFSEGILLTFFHLNSSRLFTTIRRFTEDKYQYYSENAGEIFEMARVNAPRLSL